MDRRNFMIAGAAGASSFALSGMASAAHETGLSPAVKAVMGPDLETSLVGPYLDLTTPEGNRDASARINGNLDLGVTKYGWYKGVVHGVRPGEKIRDLFGFSGFSAAKLIPNLNGEPGYMKVLREIGLYTDLETGEIMEEWTNPYLNETVRVVPIANDPFNSPITAYRPPAPTYGGLNTEKREKIPLILDWERHGNDLNLARRINLFYPSALQPDAWPRESSGPMNQVTEIFMYHLRWDLMQDASLTSIPARGVWNRVTPWLPWMLMGPTPGHCLYSCFFGANDTLSHADQNVLEYAAKHYPKYLEAPETYEEPSWSSLEWYAAEQKPAPLPESGAIPVAAPPKSPFGS